MIKRIYKDPFHFAFFMVESRLGCNIGNPTYLYTARGYTTCKSTVSIKAQLILVLQGIDND